MKIQYHSDLHLEFNHELIYEFKVDPQADILIFAGDITNRPSQALDFFQNIRKQSDIPILYVLGNHEYYGHDLNAWQLYQETLRPIGNMHLLDHNIIGNLYLGYEYQFRNVQFIGMTLYSDLSNPLDAINVQNGLMDFQVVEGIDIEYWQNRFDLDSTEIDNYLFAAKRNNHKCVVITHFAPLKAPLIAEKHKNSSLLAGFNSDLSEMILQYEPKVWIYGHTHTNIDFKLGDTQIITNQYGYHFEDPKLINKLIEV